MIIKARNPLFWCIFFVLWTICPRFQLTSSDFFFLTATVRVLPGTVGDLERPRKYQRTYTSVAWRILEKYQRTYTSVAWRILEKYQRTYTSIAWRRLNVNICLSWIPKASRASVYRSWRGGTYTYPKWPRMQNICKTHMKHRFLRWWNVCDAYVKRMCSASENICEPYVKYMWNICEIHVTY